MQPQKLPSDRLNGLDLQLLLVLKTRARLFLLPKVKWIQSEEE